MSLVGWYTVGRTWVSRSWWISRVC